MDRQMESTWEQGRKPFYAEAILPNNLIPIFMLRQVLISIVRQCELYYPPDRFTLHALVVRQDDVGLVK